MDFRLKELIPSVITVHCSGHRINRQVNEVGRDAVMQRMEMRIVKGPRININHSPFEGRPLEAPLVSVGVLRPREREKEKHTELKQLWALIYNAVFATCNYF